MSSGSVGVDNQGIPLYKQINAPVEERIDDLINRLTLREKIALLGGTGFATKPVERLGIPELKMTDGPLGVRWGKASAFPCGTAMAATWDTSAVKEIAKSIAEEVKGKGRNVILGPCVNIARLPMGGRDFESFGEDPYLASRMTVSYIEGVQSQGVAATVKHFAANNQEYQRTFVDVRVSQRALNEIYFPAFKAAVQEAHVMAVMAAYNKLNGHFCAENRYLLDTTLIRSWGFDGLVMSDWGAVHSTVQTVSGGLDLEMPSGVYLNDSTLFPLLKSGRLSELQIDEKVRRILRVMFRLGIFDRESKEDSSLISTPEHRKAAYQAAVEGIVLLKNQDAILPLNTHNIKSIAVIGPDAAVARTTGGGSAMVIPIFSISPLEALQQHLGNKIKLTYAPGVYLEGDTPPIDSSFLYLPDKNVHGLLGEYFNNLELTGKPTARRVDKTINFNWSNEFFVKGIKPVQSSVRWVGRLRVPETGNYTIDMGSDDGSRLYIDGKLVINDWRDHAFETQSYKIRLKRNKFYKIVVEYYQNAGDAAIKLGLRRENVDLIKEAVDVAKKSDVAIIFAGTSAQYETEGRDRNDLTLPANQDELIQKVGRVNKKTVVVLVNGSPVIMNKWINKVKGVLEAWFGGEEAGDAITDVLLGFYNPSGKLPMTFPRRWEDCSSYEAYRHKDSVSVYSDGIYVGYRWFDQHHIEPLFPFGYGLSYTSFAYRNLRISEAENAHRRSYKVTFILINTGSRSGTEVTQLYISNLDKSAKEPPKVLRKFNRVELNPGESRVVEFRLTEDDFAYYNEKTNSWIAKPGKYEIIVGSSSRDPEKLSAVILLH
ncbi:MAG: glycoside hydrolase family 3 C-terminal domain-containing protein [Candidatus Kryptoniota bacterium]